MPDSLVYTNDLKSYNVFYVSECRHKRVRYETELVRQKGKHIDDIENFGSQAKRILRKYNVIPTRACFSFTTRASFVRQVSLAIVRTAHLYLKMVDIGYYPHLGDIQISPRSAAR